MNRHLKDINDYKYHVYRLSNENELASSDGPIELLDSDDEETSQTHHSGRANVSTNNDDSEDECPSADEMDVKPDIHTLMRKVQEEMKIKEEVTWNCHEYDRQTRPMDRENDTAPVDNVDLDQFDMESEICVIEPPQKRQRREPIENVEPVHSVVQPEQPNILEDGNLSENVNVNIASEYQMSDTTLKEKVKNVVRSRGQQLAIDMLIAAAAASQSKDKPKGAPTPMVTATGNRGIKANTPSSSLPNNPIAPTSNTPIKPPSPEIPLKYGNDHDIPDKSIAELESDFISEITNWKYKWINDKNLNPLQFTMNIRHLDTDFTDLCTFQQFVSNFRPSFFAVINHDRSECISFLTAEIYTVLFCLAGK